MATLKSIRKRISAVNSTKKLTRAMKMIAAARLRQVEREATEARAFVSEAGRLLIDIAKRQDKLSSPLIGEREEIKAIELFLFTSDRGLCGLFNEDILTAAEEFVGSTGNIVFTTFGKKGRDFARDRGWSIRREFMHLSNSAAREVLKREAEEAVERYRSGHVDKIVLAYTNFRSLGTRQVITVPLLPICVPESREYCTDYIYEPNLDKILDWISREVVTANLVHAYLESTAAELAARLMAMNLATKNAENMIDALTAHYNRARQAAITRELIDIVTGAEALK